MLKLLHKESTSILGAATIVGALSFVSRIVGLIRDRILAGEFGAGDILDTYYAAFKIPDLLFSLIVVGALSASFIPLFTKYFHALEDKVRAWKLTNNLIHVLGASMIVFSIILVLFSEPLAALIAPGFSEAKQLQVSEFMRVMFLSQILLSLSMIFGGVLQGVKRFVMYSLAPILYNIGIIAGAIYFVDFMGPIGLAWGVVFGAFLHLLIQYIGVVGAGYKYSFSFQFTDKDSKEVLRLMGPRILGIGLSQIQLLVLTVIASLLAIGSVTVFQFAYNIQFFPIGIIGISYAIAAFPSFSEHLERKEMKKFVASFSATVRQAMFMLIPMMVLFLLVRIQIVRTVVGAGAFDWTATILTADTLAYFALSFIPQSLVFILARAFFALHDTWTPVATGLASTILGIIAAFWLTDIYGVTGLGMAYSLSACVNAGLLWFTLHGRVGSLDEHRIIRSLLKMTIAGLIAAVIMQLFKPIGAAYLDLDTFTGIFGQGFIAGSFGLGAYALLSYLLKSEEFAGFVAGFKRKFLKKAQPSEVIDPIE